MIHPPYTHQSIDTYIIHVPPSLIISISCDTASEAIHDYRIKRYRSCVFIQFIFNLCKFNSQYDNIYPILPLSNSQLQRSRFSPIVEIFIPITNSHYTIVKTTKHHSWTPTTKPNKLLSISNVTLPPSIHDFLYCNPPFHAHVLGSSFFMILSIQDSQPQLQ